MKKDKSKLSGKALLQFLVLSLGATTIYMPVLSKNLFYDAFLEAFAISNVQLGTLFSVYTLMTLLTYFLGGIVADKYSPRKLLTFSFLSTALLTVFESMFPSYNLLIFIFGGIGVTNTLTFWAALIKATRQFGQSVGGESKALGSLEGARGIAAMIINTTCVILFGKFVEMAFGLKVIFWIYAVLLFIIGIVGWFVFKDLGNEEESVSKENTGKLIIECLKNPMIWIVSLMVMGAYALTSTMAGYVAKIGTVGFAMSVQLAASITVISNYVKPIGSFSGGWLGDRLGATKTLVIGTIGMMLTAIVVIMLPSTAAMAIPFIIVYTIMAVFMGITRGQFYAPLREANVPMYLSGTATGLIATIGYSSDLFLPIISGKLLDSGDPVMAIKYIIMILIGFGIFAIIMASIMLKLMKKNKEKDGSDSVAVHVVSEE